MALVDPQPVTGPQRTLRLAGIATVAGLFSGLFGVGGGGLIVPLLILWLAYDARAAAGTSLAAIVVIAAAAAAIHEGYGDVDLARGAAVGLPALVGVLAGTAIQQRVSSWVLKLAFALVMVTAGALLVVNT